MSDKAFFQGLTLILAFWFLMEFMHQHKPVELYVDPATSCQYLISPSGALVQRMGPDYMPAGCELSGDY